MRDFFDLKTLALKCKIYTIQIVMRENLCLVSDPQAEKNVNPECYICKDQGGGGGSKQNTSQRSHWLNRN
jgi:hypothetical protein